MYSLLCVELRNKVGKETIISKERGEVEIELRTLENGCKMVEEMNGQGYCLSNDLGMLEEMERCLKGKGFKACINELGDY